MLTTLFCLAASWFHDDMVLTFTRSVVNKRRHVAVSAHNSSKVVQLPVGWPHES